MNLEGFVQEKVLGEGSYGHVYKALRLSDNSTYAVKVVDLSKLSRREIEDSVNEIRLMASFTSPFLIRFYEAFCESKRLCIVTEYAQLGDLSNLIERRKRKKRPLPEMQIWRFLLQLLEGLRVLHSVGVVHRDLKSANVLLSAPDLVKIGDLGISTVLHHTQLAKTQIGTPIYLAPEVWKRRPYDQKCDMWSLGVLLYEMMTFNFPFNARTTDELANRICNGKYSMPTNYSADLSSIVRRLLQVNPEQRPTVNDLLNLHCIKEKMNLILPYLENGVINSSPQLLETIQVPLNMRNVNLPDPSYGKKPEVIKPIAQRMHLKKNVPLNPRDITQVSTPELKIIADQDWWSPTKIENPDDPKRYSEPNFRPLDILNKEKCNEVQQNNVVDPSQKEACKQKNAIEPSKPQPRVQYEQPRVQFDQPRVQFDQPRVQYDQPRPVNNQENVNCDQVQPNKENLNPVIPPYPGYRKQPKIDDQRPLFMQLKFPAMPLGHNNCEYKPVYYDNTPRRDIKPVDGRDPRWNPVQRPIQPPIQQQPLPNNIINQCEWNEPQRKHPPVAINPRFKKIGIR